MNPEKKRWSATSGKESTSRLDRAVHSDDEKSRSIELSPAELLMELVEREETTTLLLDGGTLVWVPTALARGLKGSS